MRPVGYPAVVSKSQSEEILFQYSTAITLSDKEAVPTVDLQWDSDTQHPCFALDSTRGEQSVPGWQFVVLYIKFY